MENELASARKLLATRVEAARLSEANTRLAETETALERETALLTEAKRQNADLMAIIDKRDEALGFVPLDKGMDMQDELREKTSRLVEADALIAKGLAVVHDFLPNIGRCVLQDYQRMNEFCSEATARATDQQTTKPTPAAQPCKWCGRPVREQSDEPPADYCAHE